MKKDILPEKEYQSLAKAAIRFGIVCVAVTSALLTALFVWLFNFDISNAYFAVLLIVTIIWCVCVFIVLGIIRKKQDALRKEVVSDYSSDMNPIFRDLLIGYRFNRLEQLTKNYFFQTWELTDTGEHNNTITICFYKKGHDISIVFTESETSIIIDEETDAPVETVLSMQDFKSTDDLFDTVTVICADSVKAAGNKC